MRVAVPRPGVGHELMPSTAILFEGRTLVLFRGPHALHLLQVACCRGGGPVDVDTARADLVAFEMGQFRNADAAQAS